jgi:hypothetical protein
VSFAIEQMPSGPGEPKEWQVSSPDGMFFADYGEGTHTIMAFSLAETRRMQTLRVATCPPECACRED